MKAIIVPLNNIFLNFEKYDGSTTSERFIRNNPRFIKLAHKMGMPLVYCIAAPLYALTIISIAPFYIFNLIFHGRKKAKKKSNEIADVIIAQINRLNYEKRKNIFGLMQDYRKEGYKVLVYYSTAMIPSSSNKKILFYNKIGKIKASLKILHIFQATTQVDIEEAITILGINTKESIFIPDNNIIPVSNKQLKEETLNEIYI